MATELEPKAQAGPLAARPDYIPKGNRGQENITSKDIVIPRLTLCQSGTPQRKQANPKFIPGLSEGQFFNSVTGEIYGKSLTVIPLFFTKSRIYFKDIDEGGGILCQAPDGISCQTNHGGPCLHANWGPNGEKPECTEFFNYFCLIQPSQELIVVSLKSTGMKEGKNWNMLIRKRDADMFAGVYTIESKDARNASGQDYATYVITNAPQPWAATEIYQYAETQYNQVQEAYTQGFAKIADPEGDPDGNDAIGSRDEM